MSSVIKVIAVCILLMGSGQSSAQTLQADIGVTMTAAQTDRLTAYQLVDVTITVTNYGPIAATPLVLDSSYFTNAIEVLPFSSNECLFGGAESRPEGEIAVSVLTWYVAADNLGQPALGVGETRSCHIQLGLSSTAAVNTPYPFSLMVGGSASPDLNPDNDVATIVLQLAVPTIPTMSATMELLLIALLGLIGVVMHGGRPRFRRKAQ